MFSGDPFTYNYESNRTIENGIENYTSNFLFLLEGEEPTPNDCTYVQNRYIERDFQKNGMFTQISVIDTDTTLNYIKWYWLDQEKKKSGLVINDILFQVDRLAKDELVLKRDVYETFEDNMDPGYFEYVSEYKYSYTATYKKK